MQEIDSINLFGINNFTGNFNFNVDKFLGDKFELDDVNLSGAFDNGNLHVKNFSADGLNGNIKSNGYISTLRPIYNIKFALGFSDINPNYIFKNILAINNNSGYMSASGSFKTRGANKKDFT